MQIASVPSGGGRTRLDIYGREGAMTLAAGGALSVGPNRLQATRGREAATELEVPGRFKLVPVGTPAGSPRNVAQAYKRFVDPMGDGGGFDPDFDLAVKTWTRRSRACNGFRGSTSA